MSNEYTQKLDNVKNEEKISPKEILYGVNSALIEKGYNPVNQIVGYLLSGDPTYITSYKNARTLICKLDRDELLEDIVKCYFN